MLKIKIHFTITIIEVGHFSQRFVNWKLFDVKLYFFSFQNQMNIIDDNRIVNVMTFEILKKGKKYEISQWKKR